MRASFIPTARALLALGNTLGYAVLGAIGVPLLMLMLAAIAGNMIQHRLVWSSESLKPKFSKDLARRRA